MVVFSIQNMFNDEVGDEALLFPCWGVWAYLTDGIDSNNRTVLQEWTVGVATLCVKKQR